MTIENFACNAINPYSLFDRFSEEAIVSMDEPQSINSGKAIMQIFLCCCESFHEHRKNLWLTLSDELILSRCLFFKKKKETWQNFLFLLLGLFLKTQLQSIKMMNFHFEAFPYFYDCKKTTMPIMMELLTKRN